MYYQNLFKNYKYPFPACLRGGMAFELSERVGGVIILPKMPDSPDSSGNLYDRHPVMFRNRPFSFMLLWVFLIVPPIALIVFREALMANDKIGAFVVLAFIPVALLSLLIWFAKTRATRLRISEDQIHLEEGLLNKRHVDLHVRQIRTVRVQQDLLERVLRVGQVEVFTTGDNPEFLVKGMPNPHWIREFVRKRRESEE